MKIMIIDDDPSYAALTTRILRGEGHEVAYAPDAIAAISVARAEKPDLILLDVGLPAGDGTVVLRRLRSLTVTALTPVIVITGGDVSQDQVDLFRGDDVWTILQKPVPRDVLVTTVADALVGTTDAETGP